MPAALTPAQRAAVEHQFGPLLVLAGPGSGKTRVITHRIARLIDKGVPPYQILGLTFTNKAANEMAGRVADLVSGARVRISTFHRFCARLLRDRPEAAGLRSNFTIYDDGDQQALMRQVVAALDYDAATYSPARLLRRIGRLKNEMVTADKFVQQSEDRGGDHYQAVLAKIYPAYQAALLAAGAVDFDDLLLHVAGMMRDHEDLRASLDERFAFVLVDEYQDTNLAQYAIIRGLSLDHPNLCVTGDPDQSIYGWRGARIRNILDFERDFSDTVTIRLEENFRSTPGILRAADELIAGNVHRKSKQLIPQRDEGPPVRRIRYRSARAEAEAIAEMISEEVASGTRRPEDFAILYRVNALSRQLEQALRERNLPYQVASGVSFYDRMEVKDLVAYLRLLYNPADVVAFRRIINTPRRAIGPTTQQRVLAFADQQGITPVEALRRTREIPAITKGPRAALGKFLVLYDDLLDRTDGSMAALIAAIVNESRYTEKWEADRNEEDAQRLANVEELINAAAEYDRRTKKEGSLEEFLEQISLSNEVDDVDEQAGRVTLMTLHAAKGLEFPCVVIVGLEEGLLPHARAVESHDLMAIEEERRLLFVGITRAEDELTLTYTASREVRGRPIVAIPSEFLREMALEAVESAAPPRPLDRAALRALDSAFDESPPPLDEEDVSQEVPDDESFGGGAADVNRSNHSKIDPRKERRPAVPATKLNQLTTAAGLLSGEQAAVALPGGFALGQRVRHPRYGVGTVVGADGLARSRRLTVAFEDDQARRTFIANKSPLQPVGLAPEADD